MRWCFECPANRYVFRPRLNCSESTAGLRKWSGSEFHTVCLATENAWVSKVLRRTCRTDSWWHLGGQLWGLYQWVVMGILWWILQANRIKKSLGRSAVLLCGNMLQAVLVRDCCDESQRNEITSTIVHMWLNEQMSMMVFFSVYLYD